MQWGKELSINNIYIMKAAKEAGVNIPHDLMKPTRVYLNMSVSRFANILSWDQEMIEVMRKTVPAPQPLTGRGNNEKQR